MGIMLRNQRQSAKEVLKKLFSANLFSLVLIIALICSTSMLYAQGTATIKGKVIDNSTKQSLRGATVSVQKLKAGTFTDTKGEFAFDVPAGEHTILVKYVGYASLAKVLTVKSGESVNLDFNLEPEAVRTSEVVVTAIGLEREKKSLGYSIEEVKGSSISESKTTNVLNALTGKVAGVQVTNSAGVPGASSFIKIRGISSITGSNQPLFIIDGIPIDNSMSYSGNPDDGANNLLSGVAYSNRAVDINPEDVESMTVLKGPAATALYGIRAANGAIVITTKKGSAAVGELINVSYSTTLAFDEVNKFPEMQMKYAQGQWVDAAGKRYGQGGFDITTAKPTFRGPTTGEALSWGPEISSLGYDGATTNLFDKNGNVVSNTDPSYKKAMVPYDNEALFFQTGTTWTNNVALAGGTDLGSFYLSLSNLKSTGIVPNSTFERSTVKISGESKISNKFKASGSISYSNSGGTRIQQGSNTSGVMLGLVRTPPSFDNSNGYGLDAVNNPDAYMFTATGGQRTYRGGGGYDNPFWTVNRNPFKDNVDRLMGYFQMNYYITDWLDLMSRVGADLYTDVRKQIFAVNSRTVPSGRIFEHDLTNRDLNWDLIFNMSHQLTEDISLKFLLGHNIYETYSTSLYVQGDNLIVPNFYHISNVEGSFVRETKDKLRRQSIYGDLTLNYLDWLYFNGNVRGDASTTLPKENNTFLYGSGNLSFIFTQALKDVFEGSVINFGKLRFNYAIVGKDAPLYSTFTPYYAGSITDGWVSGISFPFNGAVGYSKGYILGSNELKPEKTTSWEFGFNMAFLDGLFDIDFTYYNTQSVDQIFAVRMARTSGYDFRVVNAGEISNKGFEAILNLYPIRSDDFNWILSLNFSKNENMVDKLAEGIDNLFIGGFEGSSIRAVAGKPYGTIFGFGFMKDPATGQTVIDDDPTSDNFGYPILDPNEKDFGSANPDWLMGVRNSISFAGLTLSFLIDIKQGGVLWNGTKGALYYFGTSKETEIRGTTKVFDGVKGHIDQNTGELVVTGGANTTAAKMDQAWLAFGNGNGFIGSNTEDFVEDASWVRLRELTLSYQIPKDIVDYTPFSDIMFTFTGRNLWLSTEYTGIDPETSLTGASNSQGLDYFNMPSTKTYNFTISVKF